MKHMVIRSKLLTKISAILSYKLKYSWTAGRQSEQEIINYHITLKRKKKNPYKFTQLPQNVNLCAGWSHAEVYRKCDPITRLNLFVHSNGKINIA